VFATRAKIESQGKFRVSNFQFPVSSFDSGGNIMDLNRWLRMVAGTFVLASLALGYWVSPKWYLFTAFVGLNLLQSAFTNWCPMMTFLRKLGVKP
jgi:hypothetical protein